MTVKRVFLLFLMIGATFWYCGDDGNNGTGPGGSDNPPEFDIEFPTLPEKMQQSNNPHAQEIKTYLMLANGLSNTYLVFLVPPANAGGDGEYSWTEDGLTVNLKITESADMYSYQVRYTGSDGEYNYDNWLAMEAQRNKAGTQSSFSVYEKETEGPVATFEYQMDASGTKTYDFKSYGSTPMRLLAEINSDGSGWAERYEWADDVFVLSKRYQWDSEGNGEWWEYTDGSVSDSGTW